jgi:hypothetical protein
VRGLAAIPADARVIVGLDLAGLRDAPVARRVMGAALGRDPDVAARLAALARRCDLDLARDVDRLVIGLGATPEEVALVATGRLDEAAIAACVGATVAGDGGQLERRVEAGRTLYTATSPGRAPIRFAFAAPDTALVTAGERWLRAGLAGGKKAADAARLAPLLALTDQTAAVWGAGEVDPEVVQGLLRASGGAIKQPPRGMVLKAELRDGIDAELAAVMASAEDATAGATFARAQLGTLALMAQGMGLGPYVSRLEPTADGQLLRLRFRLPEAETNELLLQIDRMTGPEQDTPSN